MADSMSVGGVSCTQASADLQGTLWARGILVRGVLRKVEWRFVEEREEYDAVVKLRMEAYARAGKIDPGNSAMMRDAFDANARILAGWSDSRVVASLRIMLHPPGGRWEHERFLDLDVPGLPPETDTVEITRVCIDRAWAGTDLSLVLFQRAALEVLRLGRRHILGSATRSALRLYTRIGCRVTNLHFRYAELGGGVHSIFVADVAAGVGGHGIEWRIWAVFWAEVYQQARAEGSLPRPTLLHAAKLTAWRAARPILNRWRARAHPSQRA